MKKITENLITDETDYLNRRSFIKQGLGFIAGATALSYPFSAFSEGIQGGGFADKIIKTPYGKGLKPHSFKDITNYNNFYEFGTGKRDPAKNAHTLKTKPWHIAVSGECEKQGNIDLEDFIKPHQLEERIYRFRCVEAWSMVIPWVGISLADVIKSFKPNSKAKYVVFKTLVDKQQMPKQNTRILNWPYIEGLTMAEAMNPLSFLAVGLYGKVLPNQNGAPIRLVVPWKYGFKNIKSIVSIHFQEHAPINTWQVQASSEYGFYANVNPNVDHPRWSQKRERISVKAIFSLLQKEKQKFLTAIKTK